jgi:hypothetical protein
MAAKRAAPKKASARSKGAKKAFYPTSRLVHPDPNQLDAA